MKIRLSFPMFCFVLSVESALRSKTHAKLNGQIDQLFVLAQAKDVGCFFRSSTNARFSSESETDKIMNNLHDMMSRSDNVTREEKQQIVGGCRACWAANTAITLLSDLMKFITVAMGKLKDALSSDEDLNELRGLNNITDMSAIGKLLDELKMHASLRMLYSRRLESWLDVQRTWKWYFWHP